MLALAPLACAALIVAARSPARTTLFAYAAAVPFGSGITLPVPLPPPFNTLTSFLGLVAGAAAATEVLVARRAGTRVPATVPIAICLLAVTASTYGWSVDRDATNDAVLVLASLVGLYVAVLIAPLDRRDARGLGSAIAVGGALASAYGYWLLLTDSLPTEGAGIPRFSTAGGVGDDADPNITAATLVLPLAISVHRALSASGRRRTAWAVAAAAITGGILLTASRGGVLGMAVALVVLALLRPRSGRTLAMTAGAIALVLVATAALAPAQIERLTTSGSSGRTSVWQIGLDACARECLTGSGFGTYLQVHEETFLTSPDAAGVRASLKAHNVWLQLGVEAGVASVVLLAALLVVTVAGLRRCASSEREPALAAIAGLLATNLFLANLGFKYFWLVLLHAGVVLAGADREPEPAAEQPDIGRVLWQRMRPHAAPAIVLGVATTTGLLLLAGLRPAPTRYEASTLMAATSPPDVAELGIGELVEEVFDAADLDRTATLVAQEDDLAYRVVGDASTRARAAERSVQAAEALERSYDEGRLAAGGLMVLSPASPDQAVEVAGERSDVVGAVGAGLVVAALAAVGLAALGPASPAAPPVTTGGRARART